MALTRKLSRSLARPFLFAAAAATALALLLPTFAAAAPATPTPATPTIGSVTAELTQLAKQNEALTEQYNAANIDVAAKQKAADAAQRQAQQSQTDYKAALSIFSQTIVAQYESSSVSTTGALLSSDSGQNYLDRLSSLGLLSAHRAQMVTNLNGAKAKAAAAQDKATKLLAEAKAKRDTLAGQRAQIIADTAKYKTMLAKLNAAARAAYIKRNTPTPAQITKAKTTVVPPPASVKATPTASVGVHVDDARLQKVLDFAISKVGGQYVFAGTGPAYDCSGLTMMAWAQAGVSLPHNAAAQYGYGTHVSYSELQPGDLIFLYSPITHVEIYIGNGVAVSAADEELGIRYVNVADDLPDWAGATRLT